MNLSALFAAFVVAQPGTPAAGLKAEAVEAVGHCARLLDLKEQCTSPACSKVLDTCKADLPKADWRNVSEEVQRVLRALSPRAVQPEAAPPAPPAATQAGVSWQGLVVTGLTSFVVDRFKQEVLFKILEKLREKVCDATLLAVPEEPAHKATPAPKPPEVAVKDLFPKSCELLRITAFPTLPNLGSTWRSAFVEDLGRLPKHLIDALGRIPKTKLYSGPLRFLWTTVTELAGGAQPLDAVKKALDEAKRDPSEWPAEFQSGLGCATDIRDFLRDTRAAQRSGDGASLWSAAERMAGLWKIEQPEKAKCTERVKLPDALRDVSDALTRLFTATEGLRVAGLAERDRYAAYLAAVLEVIRKIIRKLAPSIEDPWLGSGEALVIAIVVRDWGRAAVNAISLTSSIVKAKLKKELPEWFIRLTTFAADLAGARDTESVKKSFEALATPAGGYRAKRVAGARTFAITALFGTAGGPELLTSGPAKNDWAPQWSALSVPVGFDYTLGFGSWSLGFFVPLVNVGALASYRFQVEKENQAPEIGLAQIFSPGAFVTFGISKSVPFVIGLGAELTPNLRAVTDAGVTTQASALRLSLLVGFDLTILSF